MCGWHEARPVTSLQSCLSANILAAQSYLSAGTFLVSTTLKLFDQKVIENQISDDFTHQSLATDLGEYYCIKLYKASLVPQGAEKD